MNMRTKIFILFLVASMAFFSCEEYIPVELPGPERMLLVNALMSTGDTTHTVCVGVSTHEKAEKLKSGHLECWVNGELVATSDNVEKADGLLYHNVFRFRADFEAGDEVRIVVESEGMGAEATTVALDAPVIAGVDTTHLYKKSSKGSDYIKTLGMGVHVKDKPGEKNYYMLQAWNFGYAYNKRLEIDNSSEPLLNPGINLSFSESDYFANEYNIFADTGFEGGSHIFKISLLRGGISGVTVRLLALDRKTYNYINAAWFENSDLAGLTFFADKPYPTNVTGDGIGFVSVMTSTDYEID